MRTNIQQKAAIACWLLAGLALLALARRHATAEALGSLGDTAGGPAIQFAAAAYGLVEDTGVVTLTVDLSGTAATTVTVAYSTTAGSAASPADFAAVSGTLTIPLSATSATLAISVAPDLVFEADEIFTATLSAPQGAALGERDAARVTIANDDSAPAAGWSQAVYRVAENAGTATITVTLDAAAELPTTVVYSTSDATAMAPDDYGTVANAELTCPPQVTECAATIAINDDAEAESAEEHFMVALTSLGDASVATATVEIVDNESPVVAWDRQAVSVNERQTAITLTARLSQSASAPVTVHYKTVDGGALAGLDYVAVSNTLTFAAGQRERQVSVTLLRPDLTAREPDEDFRVALFSPLNATVALPDAVVTIIDNGAYVPFMGNMPPPPCADSEPGNNTLPGASPLYAGGPLCLGSFGNEAVAASDYYRLSMPGSGSWKITIILDNTTANPAAYDLDLFLYRLDGGQATQIAESRNTNQADDVISPITLQGSKTYYVRVFWYEGPSMPNHPPTYTLSATAD